MHSLAQLFALLMVGSARAWVRARLPSGATYRWTSPAAAPSDDGLGGGISWALAPSDEGFCAELLPAFSEHRDFFGGYFTSCDDVIVALDRSFGAWADNHRHLSFKRCRLTNDGGSDGGCTPELHIRAGSPTAGLLSAANSSLPVDMFAAYVKVHGTHGDNVWRRGPRDTAGTIHNNEFVVGRATLMFHSHMCWYLDATFCSKFDTDSSLFGRPVKVSIVVVTILGASWFVGLAASA